VGGLVVFQCAVTALFCSNGSKQRRIVVKLTVELVEIRNGYVKYAIHLRPVRLCDSQAGSGAD